MTKQRTSLVMAFLAMLLFVFSQISLTFCATSLKPAIVDNEIAPNFAVNFDQGVNVNSIKLEYVPLSQNEASSNSLLTKEAKEHIEKIAKDELNANYNVAIVLHYSLFTNDGATRMTDFSKVSSIEALVSIEGGQPNTAKDAYCAVFVPLESLQEKQVLENHDYSVFENVKDIAKVETINATSSSDSKLSLQMNAETDGFVFIMTFGKNTSSIGTIILVAGIVVSLILIVLLAISIRSYIIQRRRKKFNKEVKSINSLAGKSALKQFETKEKQPKKLPKKLPTPNKTGEPPKLAPKMPVKPKMPSLNNQSNAQTKNDENQSKS